MFILNVAMVLGNKCSIKQVHAAAHRCMQALHGTTVVGECMHRVMSMWRRPSSGMAASSAQEPSVFTGA